MATKVQRIKAAPKILQLHIELRGTKPKVWRRVLVPQTITLAQLHLVIQAAFGWGHAHLHEFIAGDGERYGTLDPDYDDPGSVSSESTRLTTALRRSTLRYVYDFGDNWDHRIQVEKTLPADPLLTLPFCVGWGLRHAAGRLRRRAGVRRVPSNDGRPRGSRARTPG